MAKNSEKVISKNNQNIIKAHLIWSGLLYTYLYFFTKFSLIYLFIIFVDVFCKILLIFLHLKNINLNAPGILGVLFDLMLINYIIGFFVILFKYVIFLYAFVIYSIYYEYKKVVYQFF